MRNMRCVALMVCAALLASGAPGDRDFAAADDGVARETVAGQRQVAAPHQAEKEVRTALAVQDSWVGQGENGRRWRRLLQTDRLKKELRLGAKADPKVLAAVLAAYESGAPGLKQPRFVALRDALREWLDRIDPWTENDLPQEARAAKDHFQPVTPRRLAWARARLIKACDRLDRDLTVGGDNGKAWKTYLRWDQLQAELRPAAKVDLRVLANIYRRLTSDHEGLERPPCLAVASALRSYIGLLAVAQTDRPAEGYARTMEMLADRLTSYAQRPTESDRYLIGERVGWLAGSGQAPRLVRAVRRVFSHRNLYAEASARLVDAGSSRLIDQSEPVTDVILGTRITATAHMTGQVHVRLVPRDNAAMLATVMQATAFSKSVGRNGPATIFSDGVTEIRATKRLTIDAEGIHEEPASSHATTRTITRGIAVRNGCLSGLIRRIAWRRAAKLKGRAEAIAARHAEQRVNRRYDTEAAGQISTSNARLAREFRNPLLRCRAFPQRFEASSSRRAIHLALLQATPFQLAAPGPPPELTDHYDLALRMHESLVNNLATSLLSGQTVTDDQVRETATELLGELPAEMETAEDEEPWSVTFDLRQPVTVEIADGQFTVTLRGSRFTSGERKFTKPMNISAVYSIERTPTGMKLTRQGDLEILPPRFNPKTGRLSAPQIALRQLLKKRLAKLFKPEIASHGLEFPGALEKAGKLRLAQLTTGNGWVALGWQMTLSQTVAVATHK